LLWWHNQSHMSKTINSDDQIGRRLRLRDLHTYFSVVQWGSMAKAAEHLNVSQPAISKTISDLEHTLGVRLLDRTRRGVEPTIYGEALLKRGLIAFDELKQGVRDIQFLADPTAGEIRIGCADSIAATILKPIIERFATSYPAVALQVDTLPSPAIDDPGLRDRKCDLVLGRRPMKLDHFSDDLKVEILFDDHLVVVAGKHTAWARRRKIDLADLADQPWLLPPKETWTYGFVAEAFREHKLDMPKVSLMTFSLPLVIHFLARGSFITVLPSSVVSLHSETELLKMLPVDFPPSRWPVAIVTLKERTLSPVVERFIDCSREVAKEFVDRGGNRPKR
jgi:DNA-binding transcriptional LysR family regulator